MVDGSIEERVARALPQGERLITVFRAELTSYPDSNKPYAPDEHRPEVFSGLSVPGDGWGSFIGTVGRILSNDVLNSPMKATTDPASREKWRKQRKVFWGDWTSSAGQLLGAMQPRSKTGVNPYLALTSHALRVVFVQRRRGSVNKLGEATELGWSCPLPHLTSVRDHPGMGGDCFEFGFPDSSWAVLAIDSKEEFRQHFANMLAAGA
jgi:hypothetical protein